MMDMLHRQLKGITTMVEQQAHDLHEELTTDTK
jgi:hypothetical protein